MCTVQLPTGGNRIAVNKYIISYHKIRIKIVLIHVVQAHQGVKFQLHEFINSAVDGGEWTASRNGHLPFEERASEYALNRRVDGLHSRCRHFGYRKTSSPCRELNHGPVLSLVAILTELCQLLFYIISVQLYVTASV
jgi:hypothetical protein